MTNHSQRVNGEEFDAWAQAGNTLRWLENSGPRYRDFIVGFISVGDYKARVILDGKDVRIPCESMSFASWQMCCCANTGDGLELRLRADPVRRFQ